MNKMNTRPGTEFKAPLAEGESVVLVPKEYRPNIPVNLPTGKANRPAWKADVLVMSGDLEGDYYEDVLLFQKALITQLNAAHDAADVVIGTLIRRATQDGENSYFLVDDPTTGEIRLASAYGL